MNTNTNGFYSVKELQDSEEDTEVLQTFLTSTVIGVLLTPLLAVLPSLLGDTRLWPLALAIMGFCLLDRFLIGEYKTVKQLLLAFVAVALFAVTAAACIQTGRAVAILPATCFFICVVVAWQIGKHFAAWRRCAPVPQSVADSLTRKEELYSAFFLLQAFIVVGLAISVHENLKTQFLLTPAAPWAGLFSLLTLLIFYLVVPMAASVLFGQFCTPWDMFIGTWKAIRSYINYGTFKAPRDTVNDATGTCFRSPADELGLPRKGTVVFAVVVLAALLLLFTNFFPIAKPPNTPVDWNTVLSIKPDTSQDVRTIPVDGEWILHAIASTPEATAGPLQALGSALLCILAPPIVFFIICFAVTGNYNGYYYAKTKRYFGAFDGSNPSAKRDASEDAGHIAAENHVSEAHQRNPAVNPWDAYVERLQRDHPNHFYVGRRTDSDMPVLIDEKLFKHHAHYLGGSGRGKTALGLAPLVTQMIRGGNANVLVFDLKFTDLSFFENTRIEAKEAGAVFKFFTNIPDHCTYLCNPFEGAAGVRSDKSARASNLVKDLGMFYGTEYGKGHYSSVFRDLAAETFIGLMSDDGFTLKRPLTFSDLIDPMTDALDRLRSADPGKARDAASLLAELKTYADLPTVDFQPNEVSPELLEASIKLSDLQTDSAPHVYFFGLRTDDDPERCGSLTRLLLNQLMAVNNHYFKQGKELQPTYVIVDEFQNAASFSFTRLMELARSNEVGFVLANQSLSAITDPALLGSLQTNITYRQIFYLAEPDYLNEFIYLGGTKREDEVTETIRRDIGTDVPVSMTTTRTTKEVPTYDVNDWLQMNAKPEQAIAQPLQDPDTALQQFNAKPVRIACDYHITESEFKIRSKARLPDLGPKTTTAFELHSQLRQIRASQPAATTPAPPRWPDPDG